MPAIRIRDLVKVFDRGDVRAVDGISLDVEEGEVFGFLGPNGAGKTTAVRIMTTLLTPTSGSAEVAGHDVVQHPAAVRNAIGVALQEAGLDDLSTAREFLILQGELYALRDPRGRASELLDIVGLQDAADRRIGNFSGGMKRRLDLAAGLVHQPSILFLDEPTTGLDPASRNNVWEEVRRLNDAGTTIFLTTQYLEEADALCERLAIIDSGSIVAEGSPEQLKGEISEDVVTVLVPEDDRNKARALLEEFEGVVRVRGERRELDAYVKSGAAAVPHLVRRFDDAGIEMQEISMRRPSLDDVFLRATGHRLEGADVADVADVAEPAHSDAGTAGPREA